MMVRSWRSAETQLTAKNFARGTQTLAPRLQQEGEARVSEGHMVVRGRGPTLRLHQL